MTQMFVLVLLDWKESLNEWANYPGLELWKFGNLAIFLAIAIYILRRPVSEALASRRERIKAELQRAQQEKEAALVQLSEAESLLAKRDEDIGAILQHARQEAQEERARLALAAEAEIDKLRIQAQREIERTAKVTRRYLKDFLAERSVELARESVRAQLRPEDDVRLMSDRIGELRRDQA